MLNLAPTHRFKKDLKKIEHNEPAKKALNIVLDLLMKKEKLPDKYRVDDEYIHLIRIGSHSELF